MLRKIIVIDEEKCDGCGLCVPSCKEGALKVIDGKVRLVSEVYCDGLGACLGDCPRGAITVEEREAPDFDPVAVEEHLRHSGAAAAAAQLPVLGHGGHGHGGHGHGHGHHGHAHGGGGCPGSAHRTMRPTPRVAEATDDQPSALGHWPVQLMLVSPNAQFLQGADLLICADCVPFAVSDFHARYLAGRVVLVGCPKLDDLGFYREKLEAIMARARPRSVTVLRMEVPCCGGIAQAAVEAREAACPETPIDVHVIGIDGSRQ